jgi:hypothetical protein
MRKGEGISLLPFSMPRLEFGNSQLIGQNLRFEFGNFLLDYKFISLRASLFLRNCVLSPSCSMSLILCSKFFLSYKPGIMFGTLFFHESRFVSCFGFTLPAQRMYDTMTNAGRNARFFHSYNIGEISNPIGHAFHQVLWRRFTYCLKLKNTNRHLFASVSVKTLHLGYVYVSTTFSLVRVHMKMLYHGYVYITMTLLAARLHSEILRGISYMLQRYISSPICI